MIPIKLGQVWSCKSCVGNNDSSIVIRRISINSSSVVHITIRNIRVGNESWDIDHVPISYDILLHDLDNLLDENFFDDLDAFDDAYEIWHEHKGGVLAISVNEIIESTIDTITG